MTRARNNPASKRRRKRILAMAKGFRGAKRNRIRQATEATNRAMAFAYEGRKHRKRDLRALWIIRISAAAEINDLSYSRLISGLKRNNVDLNRKMLADMAVRDEKVFTEIAVLAKN